MAKAAEYVKPAAAHRRSPIAAALLAIAAAYTPIAQAASFVIADGVTETAKQTLNDNETGVVEAGGAIAVAGDEAIVAPGVGVSIDNRGSVDTTGNYSHGIETTGVDASVDNRGSIGTTGLQSFGIYSNGDDATLSNSGSIVTTGDTGYGIGTYADNANVSNSGSIATSGPNANGIRASGDDATITNSGGISTTGSQGYGIRSDGADAAITNSGSIDTAGQNAHGIVSFGAAAAITNSGRINATGTDAVGIDSEGANATLNNTGTIISAGDDAGGIYFDGINSSLSNSGSISATGDLSFGVFALGDNLAISNSGLIQATGSNSYAVLGGLGAAQTLNVLPGSRILGRIDLGGAGDGDVANVYGSFGSAVLTFANTETINVQTGNAVKIGNTVAVIEPTGESVRAASLNGLTTGVHQVVGQRMQANRPFKPIQLAALALSPGMLHQERAPLAWGQVFGSRGERGQDGQMLAYDYDYGGLVGGYEQDFRQGRVGFLGGVANANSHTAMLKNESESVFVGVYGHAFLGPINLSAALIGGAEFHDTRRQVLDNVNGYETARSDTDSVFISPSLTLSGAYALNADWELRPAASLTYSVGRYDGYRETGTTSANLQVGSRTVQAVSTRLQLEWTRKLDQGEVGVRFGAQSRHTDGDAIEMNLGGSDFRFNAAGDENVAGGFAGFGAHVMLTDRLSLVADVEYGRLSGDENQLSGQVTLQYRF